MGRRVSPEGRSGFVERQVDGSALGQVELLQENAAPVLSGWPDDDERVSALLRENARLRDEVHRLERVAGRMRQLALHDELTGLPNRSLMHDRLRQALAQVDRDGGCVALMMLDLDRFKEINDGFGHAAGDQLLQQVAGRLAGATRGGDTVARIGGDEFVVMLPRIPSEQVRSTVLTVVTKLRKALEAAIALGGDAVRVSASIGVAVYPHDGRTVSELKEHADAAMYRDKARHALPSDWPGGGMSRVHSVRLSEGLPSADISDALAQASMTDAGNPQDIDDERQ